MNWSILIIYFVLTALAFWASSKYLGNNGTMLFSALFAVMAMFLGDAVLFGHFVNVSCVFFPFIFLAFLSFDEQYDRKSALNLLYVFVASLATVLVFAFFECVFTSVSMLDWRFLGSFISIVISVWVAGYCVLKLKPYIHKLKLQEPLILFLDLAVVAFIDSLIFVSLAYIGMMSFAHIVLTILINWLVRAIVCGAVVLFVVALRNYESKQLKEGLEIEEPTTEETAEKQPVEEQQDESFEQNDKVEEQENEKKENNEDNSEEV